MNEHLVHLIAFWSAFFVSSRGPATISAGLRKKLIELLDALPSSVEGVVELRGQAALLGETESLGADHPLNRAMLVFMVAHEKEIPDEFRTNVDNIKRFFSGMRVNGNQ